MSMLDTEEVRDLILGELKYRKCPNCDNNGLEYWDNETGLGVSSSPVGIPKENIECGACDNCNGLGYILYY